MLFRIIFYSVLFYVLVRIVNIIGRFFSTNSKQPNVHDYKNGQKKKHYSEDEIEEADYEEIK
jgi:hypothetical protein